VPYAYDGNHEKGLEITKEEYDEFLLMMSNDDEIEWFEFAFHD